MAEINLKIIKLYGKKTVQEISANELERENDINIINEMNNNIELNNIGLFNNLEKEETYITYRVYLLKEEDTIDTIMTKYKVTKEDLENYNDLENIKAGDKIIIPYIRNE